MRRRREGAGPRGPRSSERYRKTSWARVPEWVHDTSPQRGCEIDAGSRIRSSTVEIEGTRAGDAPTLGASRVRRG